MPPTVLHAALSQRKPQRKRSQREQVPEHLGGFTKFRSALLGKSKHGSKDNHEKHEYPEKQEIHEKMYYIFLKLLVLNTTNKFEIASQI